MTLKELELFYYLCENPHISQLAKQIGMSQSAISLAIKSLENKLTEPLFDRIGKKLVINDRGRVFKEKTYSHFLTLKDAQNQFSKDKLSGILNIASSKTISAFILPQIIFNFLSENKDVTINKQTLNSTQTVQKVLDGQIDIGFIENSINEVNLVKEEIGCDDLIIVSADKSLIQKEYFIDQLFSKKWILREVGSGTREVFLKNIGKISKEINIFMEFSSFEEIKNLLPHNHEAITCISKSAVLNELKKEELFEIKIKNITFKRKLHLIYHKNKYQSTLFKTFKEYVKNYKQ